MKTWTRRKRIALSGGALVLLSIGFLLFAWSPHSLPETSTQWFDLEEVRTLARQGKQEPYQIEVVKVAESQNPRCIVLGFNGCEKMRFVSYGYRITGPEQVTVLEAPAGEETLTAGLPFLSAFNRKAFLISQQWLSEADLIVATHEHFDHIGGLAEHPDYAEIARKAFVTLAQIEGPEMLNSGFESEATRARLKPVLLEKPTLIAPGIVAIPAAGHTSGSIWIYVALEDGHELLFVGDTAWRRENIELPRGTPRMVAWGVGANGDKIADQLLFLHRLQKEHPELSLVVAHDPLHHKRLIEEKTFVLR